MKNIYLVGFMATGKSAVARQVAKSMGLIFLDLDSLIEEREGMRIVDIFAQKGEPYFRSLEQRMIEEVSHKTDLVVSCGGGAVVNEVNVAVLKQTGVVFCLHADVDTILKRASLTDERPLLNTENPRQKITELLSQRKKFYAQAHYQIDTTKLSVNEVADKVVSIAKKEVAS